MEQVQTGSKEFHVHEFEALRTELLSLVKEINQVEKNVVIGTALVYSWLAVSSDSLGTLQSNLFWFMPLLFTVLGSLKVYMLKDGVMEIAKYLYQLENTYRFEDNGWQHFRERKLGKGDRPFGSYLVFSIAFWGMLFIVNLAVPIMMLLNR